MEFIVRGILLSVGYYSNPGGKTSWRALQARIGVILEWIRLKTDALDKRRGSMLIVPRGVLEEAFNLIFSCFSRWLGSVRMMSKRDTSEYYFE